MSNLPTKISKTELEAMSCRAEKIVYSLLPVTGRKKGFGFVRFSSKRRALNAKELSEVDRGGEGGLRRISLGSENISRSFLTLFEIR